MTTSPDKPAAAMLDPDREALRLHALYRGKVQMMPKCPIRGLDEFAVWYTPGVAAACRAIAGDPEAAYRLTNRGNTIAIISDGTRVLGLGDIGPLAGLPVMEGKALLFKYLGGVDAVPLCLDVRSTGQLIAVARAVAPSFAAINLEDIAQPKCFRILERLRRSLAIPVWHDDQQGSATAALAGALTALGHVGKDLRRARIVLVGAGAANVATYRLLKAQGADLANLIACDSRGILHRERRDIAARRREYPDKWRICRETNAARRSGGIAEALRGADLCIAFSRSGPGVIEPRWVEKMARDAIVFACANPVPEIWPGAARAAGARVVATGRSDLPNQLNNALAFPGIFRGVLDVRARAISDGMAIAAAHALARYATERGVADDSVLPPIDDVDVAARVAAATAVRAQAEGLAAGEGAEREFRDEARRVVVAARAAAAALAGATGASAPDRPGAAGWT